MEIQNKVFIVTGASRGLGEAISANLVSKGARIAAISRSAVADVGTVKYFQCDISDKVQVRHAIASIVREFGQIDGLVNCAGLWLKTTLLEDINLDDAERILDTNLKGMIFVTKEVLPYLKKAPEASLINISSKSGTRPMDLQAVYCASKYGVKGFTDALKLELKDSTVKVMGLYPSGMNTKMFETAGESFSTESFMDTNEIAKIVTFAIERPGNISIEEIQIDKY